MVAIHIYNTRLDSRSCQEHAHARVCPALTYSFHQCPGVMPGFIWGYAYPGVAYPGVRDNCSTLNTKTGYDDMMIWRKEPN